MGLYQDEWDGCGGLFTVDPKTGKRTRVDETFPTPPVRAPKPQPATESEAT